jgi:sugar phosphate isomerase/epimerase
VVLHCGRVEAPDQTKHLINLFERRLTKSEEFAKAKDRAQRERDGLIAKHFNNALASLEELERSAQKENILLGIETRYYLREIPSLEEIGIILEKFKGSNIRYWHDTGHGQVMENLGFTKHKDFLDLYGKELLGIHLHDILGCRDHMAPGKGRFDFSRVKSYLSKETIKVIEAHHPATCLDIQKSKKLLETAFDGKI